MKRILAILLLLAMTVTMFVGCGTGKITDFEVPENGYDGSEVSIMFYHTMGQDLVKVLEDYITEFNKLYPKIHVQHKQVGSYDDVRDTISTEITVGDQPNIAYCYPDHVALFNLSGAVATLDDLINSQIPVTRADGTTEILGLTQAQQDDFIQGYYNEGKQFGDGLMYTMPFQKSTEVLYYNKTFFEKNNLKVPTTWDEMEEVCARIKEIDPKSTPLGYDSEANWFITMCEQYGSDYTSASGEHYTFDNETNRAFVERFRRWYEKGYVTTQGIYTKYTSYLFNESAADKNKCYMSIGSSGGAKNQVPKKVNGEYPFEVDITSIPQVNPANPKVISQGPSVCIFKKNNPQEVVASWLFVKFLTTSVGFQAEFSMVSGYVPVLKSVVSNPTYAELLSKAGTGNEYIIQLSAKICMDQEAAYYTSPAFNGSSSARDQVGKLLQKCISDSKADIAAEFAAAVAKCKEND